MHPNKQQRPLCRVIAIPSVVCGGDLAEITVCWKVHSSVSGSRFLYSCESVHNPCETQQGEDTRSRKGDKPKFSSVSGWPKGNRCGLKETGGKTQAGIPKINEPSTRSLLELLSVRQRSAEPKTELKWNEKWKLKSQFLQSTYQLQQFVPWVMAVNPATGWRILFYHGIMTQGKIQAQKSPHGGTWGMFKVWFLDLMVLRLVTYKLTLDTEWFIHLLHQFNKEELALYSRPQPS